MARPTLKEALIQQGATLAAALAQLAPDERIEALNAIRSALHEVSPFRAEPVDLVLWVRESRVRVNEYNPNSVAPDELDLLLISMVEDGVTQPIVACPVEEEFEVIDGEHRSKTARKAPLARRLLGYLPVTLRAGTLAERMAATVRHNRARGKHRVQSMAELLRRFEAEGIDRATVARALGMDAEEVMRLTRVGGVAQALAGRDYSRAWEAEDGE